MGKPSAHVCLHRGRPREGSQRTDEAGARGCDVGDESVGDESVQTYGVVLCCIESGCAVKARQSSWMHSAGQRAESLRAARVLQAARRRWRGCGAPSFHDDGRRPAWCFLPAKINRACLRPCFAGVFCGRRGRSAVCGHNSHIRSRATDKLQQLYSTLEAKPPTPVGDTVGKVA